MRQLFPALRVCDSTDVYADLVFDSTDREVWMNVVSTVDGRTAIDNKSHGIGSATDHVLMRQIRAGADAVLFGAGTIREECVSPRVPAVLRAARIAANRRPQPLSVVLGGRDGVDLRGRLALSSPDDLIVFLPHEADPAPLNDRATVYRAESGRPDPIDVVRILHERHKVRRLLLEGGPSIYTAFLQRGLVDQIFWTVAPKVSADASAADMLAGTAHGGPPHGALLQTIFEHEGELYLRYRLPKR